ncbi:MAG: 50S ribosomal protein L17 [Candidatus Andersenbacteria bacterium]
MKHKHANRILSRRAHHRHALLSNLTSALLKYNSLITTEAKGKELRRFFEPLVTEAKKELTLARRRRLLAQLLHAEDLPRLQAIAAQVYTRPGGYLRLTKLPRTRTDGAKTVRVDIVTALPTK